MLLALGAQAQVRVGGALSVLAVFPHSVSDEFQRGRSAYAGGSANAGADLRLIAEAKEDSTGYLRYSLGYSMRRMGLSGAWGSTHFAAPGVDLDLTLQLLDLNVGYSFPVLTDARSEFRMNIGFTAAYLLRAMGTGRRDDFIMITARDSTGTVLGSYPSTQAHMMDNERLQGTRTLNFGAELSLEAVSHLKVNDLFVQFGGQYIGLHWDALPTGHLPLLGVFVRVGLRFPDRRS